MKKKLLGVLTALCLFALMSLGSGESSDSLGDYQSETSEKVDKATSLEDFTIDEQTIYDGNDVVIKVTDSEISGNDASINIYIENNGNLNLGFNAHAYAVNGIMTRNNIYSMDCDVAAGKKGKYKSYYR